MAVPSFITQNATAFDAVLRRFAVQQKKRAVAIDPQLAHFADLTHTSIAHGKRLRPLLVRLGYEAASAGSSTITFPAGLSVELFHAFALVHDDIMDRADQRRGISTIHRAVENATKDAHRGLGTAILGGDLLFVATDQFDTINLPPKRRTAARQAFQRMAEETILGQQLEFDFSFAPSVSLDDILRAMAFKSGRYSIEWPLTIGAILGGASSKQLASFSSFSIPLGIAFQIRDDILGTFGDPKQTGKPVDSDIKEGKHTLLAYFAHEGANAAGKKLLRRTLGNQRATGADVSRVRSLMRDSGAFERADALARELTQYSLDAIAASPLRPQAKQKMTALARFLVDRTV